MNYLYLQLFFPIQEPKPSAHLTGMSTQPRVLWSRVPSVHASRRFSSRGAKTSPERVQNRRNVPKWIRCIKSICNWQGLCLIEIFINHFYLQLFFPKQQPKPSAHLTGMSTQPRVRETKGKYCFVSFYQGCVLVREKRHGVVLHRLNIHERRGQSITEFVEACLAFSFGVPVMLWTTSEFIEYLIEIDCSCIRWLHFGHYPLCGQTLLFFIIKLFRGSRTEDSSPSFLTIVSCCLTSAN